MTKISVIIHELHTLNATVDMLLSAQHAMLEELRAIRANNATAIEPKYSYPPQFTGGRVWPAAAGLTDEEKAGR